jgi:NADH-quinone oxidoreductase subunit I
MSGVVDVSRRVPDRLTLLQRLYIPEILRGMSVTIRHLLRNLASPRRMPTIQYPEQRRNYSGRFRGKHILKTRDDGTLKCVACYMCAQACPAECITIVAGEHPKIAYEKYPVVFDIDMMRCVFCGFCVDACPKDAIWMTRNYELAFLSREEAIFSIDRLREKPEEIARYGYGYRPYYPGDGTTPPTDASRLPVIPGDGERDRLREESVPLPDRTPGHGPLNAPSHAAKAAAAAADATVKAGAPR